MKMILSFLILVILSKVNSSKNVKTLATSEINTVTTSTCVLLGVANDASSLSLLEILEDLSNIFREESGVYIALLSDSSAQKNVFYNKSSTQIIFYPKQSLDRSCLLSLSPHIPKKTLYQGSLDLNSLVSFLNEYCHTYRTVSGGLQPTGILHKQILSNIAYLHRQTDNCVTITDFLTPSQFFWEYLTRSQPLVIKGAIKHWMAFQKWTTTYLRQKYGSKQIHIKMTKDGIFEGVEPANLWPGYHDKWIPDIVKNQLSFPDLVVVRPATDEMLFSDFLDLVTKGINKTGISAYLEYSSIPYYMPELKDDIEELMFVKGLLKKKHLNMWLSDGNTLGKLHFDPFDNILCQISGEKHLTLFEPHHNINLYEAHIPEALLGYDKERKSIYRKVLLQSTSMVMSPVDILQPDFERFPNFRYAKKLHCHLEPGDALFMPAFWWHEVQSFQDTEEHRNLAVNYWYEPFFTKEFPCSECKLDVNPEYRNLLQNPPKYM